MYVKNNMMPKNQLVTLDINESLRQALEKIKEGDFLSLPVFEKDIFKGILMKEHIFRGYFEKEYKDKKKYLEQTKVGDLYNAEYQTIKENEYIENASYLLNQVRKPFLPVVNESGKFVGILTHNAIFNAFTEIFGLNKGVRIAIDTYDIPGQIAKLSEVIKRASANIINFAVLDTKVMDVHRIIVRVNTDDVKTLVERIEKAGFKVAEVD